MSKQALVAEVEHVVVGERHAAVVAFLEGGDAGGRIGAEVERLPARAIWFVCAVIGPSRLPIMASAASMRGPHVAPDRPRPVCRTSSRSLTPRPSTRSPVKPSVTLAAAVPRRRPFVLSLRARSSMSLPMTGSPDMPELRNDAATKATSRATPARARSIAIAVALAALVVLFYLVTIVKLGPGVHGAAAMSDAVRARPGKDRADRRRLRGLRRRHGRHVLRRGAALPPVLPGDRPRRHHRSEPTPPRTRRSTARSRSASTPMSATASAGASGR